MLPKAHLTSQSGMSGFRWVGLKLNIQKTKIMASGPTTSWQIDGETVDTVADFILGAPKSLCTVIAAMKLKMLAPWNECYDQPRQHIKKQRQGTVLRWQRNRTGRPLSPPQIHRNNIWTLSRFQKTTSECWQRTSGTQKGSPLSWKGGRTKYKR